MLYTILFRARVSKMIIWIKSLNRFLLFPSKFTMFAFLMTLVAMYALPVIEKANAYEGNVKMLASALPKDLLNKSECHISKKHPCPIRKPKK